MLKYKIKLDSNLETNVININLSLKFFKREQ